MLNYPIKLECFQIPKQGNLPNWAISAEGIGRCPNLDNIYGNFLPARRNAKPLPIRLL